MAAVERKLAGEITERTWIALSNAMQDYLGSDLAYLITWLVVDDNPAGRLSSVAQFASAGAMQFLKTLLAVYGEDLVQALAVGTGVGNDWRTLFREVNVDQLSNRFTLRLRVLKLNGEWTQLEGPPDSFLNLARNVIAMLRAVGPTDVFSPMGREAFLDEADPFVDALRRARVGGPDSLGPAPEPPGVSEGDSTGQR